MKKNTVGLALVLLSAMVVPAFAQTATAPADPNNAAVIQRDINQERRIEQGLKSGQLSTGEAARLEKGEARIDRMESNADKNGSISAAEKARIEAAQNRESANINRLDNNNIQGNPNSASSQRMQADVQRDVNQQKRIENGEQTGSLTAREVGKLEHGQAKDDRQQYRDGRKGYLTAKDQKQIQKSENHQSERIYKKKHNDITAQ